MSEHKVQLSWKSGPEEFSYEKYDRTHALRFPGGQAVKVSSTKETFGREEYTNPEELLAGSLGCCHMLTFLAIAAKKKLIVDEYQDDPVAILEKGTEGKVVVTKIFLRPRVSFKGEIQPDADTLHKLHESAHKNCFIGNSIRCEVIIDPVIQES